VGSQHENIKERLTSKSLLATWLLTPAIVAGIALVGFQTYSLISGKSISDLDFGIGKLWSTDEPVRQLESASNTKINLLKNIKKELEIDVNVTSPIENAPLPVVKRKEAKLNTVPKLEVNREDKPSGFISTEEIVANRISANFGDKRRLNYINRLQNEYLISPGLIPHRGKWYIGLNFLPGVSYRRFGYNTYATPGAAYEENTQYTFGPTEDERNKTDRGITTYAIGLDFGRRLSPRLSLFSGIHYTQLGEQMVVKHLDLENPNRVVSSFMDKEPTYERSVDEDEATIPYTNKYRYFEVPIGLTYDAKTFKNSKIAVNAAVVFQKLDKVNALAYDFNTDYYYWMNNKEELYSQYGLGGSLSVAFSQYVVERFEVYIAPQFRYNVTSTFNNSYPITQNQFNTGIQVGFKQHLF